MHPGLGGALVNPKRILVALMLALAVSGACTWLVSKKLTAPPTTQRLRDATYVAPSMALQAGEVLGPGNTELVAWPENIPLDGGFSRTADVMGRAVLFPLGKGQPILNRDLSATGSGNGLASKIPDGMRAVALRSDEVVGVAGFLIPGSHLDVLVTYRPDGSNDPLTVTVLQDAVVLAAGHQVEPDPEGKSMDVTVMTLLLTPEEAQRAVLASTQGTIHFVLRNGRDTSRTEIASTLLSQLAGRPAFVVRTATRGTAPATAAKPIRHEIETILGGSSDERPAKAQDGGAGQ
jgi:pilus assembly protein CpaB